MNKKAAGVPEANPPTRRERKKQETRRRIFRAAFDLFREKGFQETTVEEIAERADVGKGTVFNHFPRKRSFLSALFEDWVSRITEEMGPVETWTGPTRSKLERQFLFLANLSAQSPDLFREAVFEHLRTLPELKELPPAGAPVWEFLAMTRAVIEQGQRDGDIRADLNLDHAASLLESAVFKTLVLWLMRSGALDELRDEISGKLDILFAGMAP